ncbi:glycosyltransferase, partial [Halorubrum sp. SP3]
MQEAITVSILIPAYNEEAYIEGCIKSILSQDTSFRYEIVVCDD